MTFANQRQFDAPGTKLRAMGYNTSLNPQPHRPEVESIHCVKQSLLATGGIENPQERVVAAGTKLVRFGSGVLVPQVAAGEWWLDWGNYQIVEQYADAAGKSVPVAVRELCCVPLEWSDMTIVVQARVIQPLLAYEGSGASATVKEGREHLDGMRAKSLGLTQMFIPGLSDPDLRRDSLMVTGYGLLPHELSQAGYFPQHMP
ncbi:hypothetical protein [Novosphingobium sp. KACC 22771]|uniref:hypothetical protein n=1 Tax=Novosphingobium sp. KACC 22771 TaxID=3025670 RepID=UPI002366A9B0|nr:hypothetical protein [Novosphingobium sp. KACC 22771]WDF73077.1 hypothetical protein PQ467_03280 [Novosphingobium sp. KACC 22771]